MNDIIAALKLNTPEACIIVQQAIIINWLQKLQYYTVLNYIFNGCIIGDNTIFKLSLQLQWNVKQRLSFYIRKRSGSAVDDAAKPSEGAVLSPLDIANTFSIATNNYFRRCATWCNAGIGLVWPGLVWE